MIISFHHACLDGWSLAVVMTELCQEYASLLRNEQIQIPAPRISYRDFVQLERRDALKESLIRSPSASFASEEVEAHARYMPLRY